MAFNYAISAWSDTASGRVTETCPSKFCNSTATVLPSCSQVCTKSFPPVCRLLQVQNTTRLCVVRDLTEHDVVSRIMRKENYLIGMLNKGVLALHVGTPCLGLRKKFMLTKTLEWNLHWCLLDCMFGEDFRLKPAFLNDARALQRRFRLACTPLCFLGSLEAP